MVEAIMLLVEGYKLAGCKPQRPGSRMCIFEFEESPSEAWILMFNLNQMMVEPNDYSAKHRILTTLANRTLAKQNA
jgi:hypothetical protein